MEPSRSTKRASHAPRPACLAGRSRLRSGQISTPRESARSAMRAPMKARVHVTLKNGVLDPQGKAIEHALAALGFAGVDDVRQGKVIEFQLAERIGRASWRERGCRSVYISVVAVSLQNKTRETGED